MENSAIKKEQSIIEAALILLLFLILLWALYKVIGPFFGVFTYAVILSVSFDQPYANLVNRLNGKKTFAAILYVILLIGLMAVPFLYFLHSLGSYFHKVQEFLVTVKSTGFPPLPQWVISLPLVGENIKTNYILMQQDPNASLHLYEHQIRAVLSKLAQEGAGLLGAALEMILGIIISAILLTKKEKFLPLIYKSSQHIVGLNDGPAMLESATKAVKGVAIGVMGTGFISAIIAWIGLSIAGVNFATGIAALLFLFVIIQAGPLLIMIPLALWLGYEDHTGQAIFVVILGILLMLIDTFLKPLLIAKSGKLPVLVLFIGVLGGLMAWGFTGMFKGAIVLAVAYTIFNSWIARHPPMPIQNDKLVTE